MLLASISRPSARIEDGTTASPSLDLIDAIALETDVRPAFFEREPVPALPPGSLVYRARSKVSASERHQASQYVRLLVEQMQEMATRLSLPQLRLPQADDPAQAARLTRVFLSLDPLRPVPHLVNTLERHGIVVLGLPFEMQKIDAFSTWAIVDGERPVITLSSGNPGDRIRFSVSHELGHLVMHRGLNRPGQDIERDADKFAAEFLLPEQPMRQILSEQLTLANAAKLKARWRVSIQTLVRRARDLGVITDRHYRYLFEQIGRRGWRKTEPVDVPVERPRLFRQIAEMVYGTDEALGLANGAEIKVALARTLLDQYDDSYIATSQLTDTEPYYTGHREHKN